MNLPGAVYVDTNFYLSFTVMKRNGLSVALTADHHFEQAGRLALLLHEPTGP